MNGNVTRESCANILQRNELIKRPSADQVPPTARRNLAETIATNIWTRARPVGAKLCNKRSKVSIPTSASDSSKKIHPVISYSFVSSISSFFLSFTRSNSPFFSRFRAPRGMIITTHRSIVFIHKEDEFVEEAVFRGKVQKYYICPMNVDRRFSFSFFSRDFIDD